MITRRAVRCGNGGAHQGFERVVGGAGVAVGENGDALENAGGGRDLFAAQAAVFVGESPAEQADNFFVAERLQRVDAGAGEQGRDHFKGRIFGGGADQGDGSSLDVGEKSVLLGLVEAMHLIDEYDGALSQAMRVLGGGHHVLDFADAAEHGAEGHEFGLRAARDQPREGGFAAAGRTPQNHGAEIVALDGYAEGLAGTQQFLLAGELLEGAGAHAFGERARQR